MARNISRRSVLQATIGSVLLTAGQAVRATAQNETVREWPQAGRDGAQTGYNPNASGPLPAETQQIVESWSYSTESDTAQQPIVLGSTVYITSGTALQEIDTETGTGQVLFEASTELFGPPIGVETGSLGNELYVATADGSVIGVSTATRNELWRQSISESEPTAVSLSESGGVLYAGTLFSTAALDTGQQSQLWSAPVGITAPVAAGGEALWAHSSNGLVGFTTEWPPWRRDQPEITQQRQIDNRWVTEDSRRDGSQVGPVMTTDDNVYTSGRGVMAFDSETGQRLWQFDEQIGVVTAPSLGDGLLYFASGTEINNVTKRERENAGTVYAVDPDPVSAQREPIREELITKQEELRQRSDAGGNELGSAEELTEEIESLRSNFEETIQFGESAVEWTFETDGPINTKPAVTDDTVFVASDDGFVYALNASTGQERWRYQVVESASAELSDPVVVGEQLYIGTQQRGVIALGVSNTDRTAGESSDENTNTAGENSGNEENDNDSENGGTADSDDGSGPGFGISTGLTALGGVGYLLRRRLRSGREGASGEFRDEMDQREQQDHTDQ